MSDDPKDKKMPAEPGAKLYDLDHYRVKKQMEKLKEFEPYPGPETWIFFWFPEDDYPFFPEDEE